MFFKWKSVSVVPFNVHVFWTLFKLSGHLGPQICNGVLLPASILYSPQLRKGAQNDTLQYLPHRILPRNKLGM